LSGSRALVHEFDQGGVDLTGQQSARGSRS
jgi:hypothetical protein